MDVEPIPSRRYAGILRDAFALDPGVSAGENEFVQCVLQRGLLTPFQVEECRAESQRRRAAGEDAGIKRILLEKGYLSAQQIANLLQEQEVPEGATRGRVKGRYRILRKIGTGAMGTVYAAEDFNLQRVVALKLIPEEEGNAEPIARLHREAAIMARLRHTNIVAVHEVGVDHDLSEERVHFIAMDYIPGKTLAEVLSDSKRDLRDLLRMLEDVARALAYAHAEGVLHRDLKPANILVEPNGRALLTDFGLAQAPGLATGAQRMAKMMGTPIYMAPEQVEGKSEEIDAKTDLYALGVILYEVLTGQVPFQANTLDELFGRILAGKPIRPRLLRSDLAPELEAMCLKALALKKSDRYPSALEFANDLARFRQGEPIHIWSGHWFYRARKRFVRWKSLLLVTAGMACVLGALYLGVGAIRKGRHAREALMRAQEQERRGRFHEAEAEYQALLRTDEGHQEARTGLARIQKILQDRAESLRLVEKARPALEEASRILYSKEAPFQELRERAERAQKWLEEALARNPELAVAHYLMGQAWELLGWWDRAEASWRAALRIDPKFGGAHYQLGRILLERASLDSIHGQDEEHAEMLQEVEPLIREGTQEIEAARREGSGFNDVLQRELASARLTWARGETDRLREILTTAIQTFAGRPGVEEFHLLRATATKMSSSEAIQELLRALAVRPKFSVALFWSGIRYRKQSKLDEALQSYGKAIEYLPRFAQAYNNRGIIHGVQKNYEAAISDFTRAIELRADYASAYLNRALALQKQGDVEGSLGEFSTTIRLRPHWGTPY